jgi:acyl-CoA thioester hydrolase
MAEATAIEALWDHPQPFCLQLEVKAEHIDALNHTNNTVYVKWCEDVAWAHSSALGLDVESYRQLNRAMAITRSEYNYLQASRQGDELIAATWITQWNGKLTMRRHFQILRPNDGVTVLRGTMDFVCIEISTGRPRRMPAEFIDGYGPAVLNGP